MKTNFFLLLFLFAAGIASAQMPDPAQAVRDLNEGVLVVRLRTQSNKIGKLEEYLGRETPGTSAYERLAQQLEETIRETTLENDRLVSAFADLYRFSDVLFVYDTLAPRLKEDDPSGIFMREPGAIDPSLSLDGRPFLIASMGVIVSGQAASGHDESLVVYDRRFNALPRPFPGYQGMTTIQMLWLGLSKSEDEVRELNIRYAVERLNNKLFRYHNKVGDE